MKKTLQFSLLFISLVLFSGCRYSTIEYAENPTNIKDKEQAKKIMQRIISEQPNNGSPLQMTVDDECIAFNIDRRNMISLGSLKVAKSIYYTTPDRLELVRRRSTDTGHVIIWRGKNKIYQVNCFSVDDGKKFIDAFSYMQHYNQNKEKAEATKAAGTKPAPTPTPSA